MRILHLTPILFVLFAACHNPDACLQGAGKAHTRTIPLSEISHVHIHGIFVVELVPDTCNKVEVQAGENLLKSVHIEQNETGVHCYNASRCAMFKGYEKIHARVHFSHIDSLTVWEACEIHNELPIESNLTIQYMTMMGDVHLNLNNQNTKITTLNKAGGLIELSGTSTNANFSINYTAELRAQNLHTETTTISSTTRANCTVYATQKLSAAANRKGKILYAGNPQEVVVKNGRVEAIQ
ncbi:MAG: DUF2807 domain-containing protein [Bacteroidales bacterium]|jgi:hypothetical protein|nr:DUF2807 domain-containing protein [Bacteroidales bacterium]